MWTRTLPLVALAATLAALTACGTPEVEIHIETPEEAPKDAPAKKGKKAGADKAKMTSTLVGLEQGDVACYVQLKDADGTEHNLHGDFELCEGGANDATAHIGKAVNYVTSKEKVMGDTCEGDPECTDTKVVDFVVKLKPAS